MSASSAKSLVFKKIIIGCDHAALELKDKVVKYLNETYKNSLAEIYDAGVYSLDRVDYPDVASHVCKKIQNKEYDGGILLCGTGIGISIAANKFNGIRAGLVHDEYTARMTRMHNDANVLSFGGRTTGDEIAKQLVDTFLTTPFAGAQHATRVDKLAAINLYQQQSSQELSSEFERAYRESPKKFDGVATS